MASFGDKLAGWLNGSAITLALSIGHRTGLFNALQRLGQEDSQGHSIAEIAKAAGLHERYVQVGIA